MEKAVSQELQKLILEIQEKQEKLRILDKTIETLESKLNTLHDQRSALFAEYENDKGMLNHKLYSDKVSRNPSKK